MNTVQLIETACSQPTNSEGLNSAVLHAPHALSMAQLGFGYVVNSLGNGSDISIVGPDGYLGVSTSMNQPGPETNSLCLARVVLSHQNGFRSQMP